MVPRKTQEGTGAINYSFQPPSGQGAEIICIKLHLSDMGGGNVLTVKADSGLGSSFDFVYDNQAMEFVTDYMYGSLKDPIFLEANDILKIEWSNPNSVTYGLEVLYR